MKQHFTGMFEKALEFALQKHRGKKRKATRMPYFWHPISVAENIEEVKQSRNLELLMTAAILHDTVEDCPDVSIQDIAKIFGYQVASLVDELTSDPKQIRKLGKTEYLKNKMANMTSYGLVIKLADRLHNVEDLPNMSQVFRRRYTKETMEIIQHLELCKVKLTKTHKRLIGRIKEALKIKK